MGTNKIELQYRQTMRKADLLEDLGNKLINVADGEMNEIYQSLQSGWKGDAGDFYSRYQNTEVQRIRVHGKKLIMAAGVLRKAAETVRQVDLFWASFTGR